jgi:hypothetical protein
MNILCAGLIAPVLLLAPTPATSTELYSDWSVKISPNEGGAVAFTENPTGEILALVCLKSESICTWNIGYRVNCKKDLETAALAASNLAVQGIRLRCLADNRDTRSNLSILEDAEVNILIISASVLAFSVPDGPARFRTIEFSPKGALQATLSARKSIEN